jgi:hypothetical protein
MSARTYAGALDGLLVPLGFTREGKVWTRLQDGFLDQIDLQVSSIAGTTANLWCRDLTTQKFLEDALPPKPPIYDGLYTRIPSLVGGLDHWSHLPEGPAELCEKVRVFGLPIFAQMRFLEHQAMKYGRFGKRPSMDSSKLILAVTLHRMGKTADACAALANTPKTMSPYWIPYIEALRRKLGCEAPADGGSAEALTPRV